MSNNSFEKKKTEIIKSLEGVRDALFDCSREIVMEEYGGEWQKAESLFKLAKGADVLRREFSALFNSPLPLGEGISETDKKQSEKKRKANFARSSRKRKEDYPKYYLRNQSILKIGLGRDKKTEYEQVVPKEEVDKILARLIAMTASYQEFTAEDVQEDLECPMYQTYIVLSLLRHCDLLTLPRRGTYNFPTDTECNLNSVWNHISHKITEV